MFVLLSAFDQANDTGKAFGIIQGIAAILFTFLDVAADLGLGFEYLIYGMASLKAMSAFEFIPTSDITEDAFAALNERIGLAGILNIIFCVLTFAWIAAGVVFQVREERVAAGVLFQVRGDCTMAAESVQQALLLRAVEVFISIFLIS